LRWKLLIIASLAATVAGAGACLTLVYLMLGSGALSAPKPFVAATLLLPLAAITYAAIFVYRHTARRRKIQVLLTALLSIVFTTALLFGTLLLISFWR
jgi:hypothetical protein